MQVCVISISSRGYAVEDFPHMAESFTNASNLIKILEKEMKDSYSLEWDGDHHSVELYVGLYDADIPLFLDTLIGNGVKGYDIESEDDFENFLCFPFEGRSPSLKIYADKPKEEDIEDFFIRIEEDFPIAIREKYIAFYKDFYRNIYNRNENIDQAELGGP
jgi:hypothetical protein